MFITVKIIPWLFWDLMLAPILFKHVMQNEQVDIYAFSKECFSIKIIFWLFWNVTLASIILNYYLNISRNSKRISLSSM